MMQQQRNYSNNVVDRCGFFVVLVGSVSESSGTAIIFQLAIVILARSRAVGADRELSMRGFVNTATLLVQ